MTMDLQWPRKGWDIGGHEYCRMIGVYKTMGTVGTEGQCPHLSADDGTREEIYLFGQRSSVVVLRR